jgi:hypothetical protein
VSNLEFDEGVSEVETSEVAGELGLCEHVIGELRKAKDNLSCGEESSSVGGDKRREDGGRENAHVKV